MSQSESIHEISYYLYMYERRVIGRIDQWTGKNKNIKVHKRRKQVETQKSPFGNEKY